MTFTERGDRTLARTVSAFQSVQDRDAMVASGMERGVHDSGERLAELLPAFGHTPTATPTDLKAPYPDGF